jgi:hypothetical protein
MLAQITQNHIFSFALHNSHSTFLSNLQPKSYCGQNIDYFGCKSRNQQYIAVTKFDICQLSKVRCF